MCWSNQWYGGDLRTFSDLPFIGTPFLVLPPDRIDPPLNSWPFRLSPSFEPVSRSFLIRQVYVCASHFFRLLFWVSPCICICVRVCRRTKGLRRKETARAGCEREREKERADRRQGRVRWQGCEERCMRVQIAYKSVCWKYLLPVTNATKWKWKFHYLTFVSRMCVCVCACVCECVRVCACVCECVFSSFFR